MGIVSEQAVQFDALTCAGPHRCVSICIRLGLCVIVSKRRHLYFFRALSQSIDSSRSFEFLPEMKSLNTELIKQRLFTEKCREKCQLYRFRQTLLFLFILTLSVCVRARKHIKFRIS